MERGRIAAALRPPICVRTSSAPKEAAFYVLDKALEATYTARVQSLHYGPVQMDQNEPVPAVRMHRIVKRFGRVIANDEADFEAAAGEIHALVGQNGAGKSTLMKILAGYHHADSGLMQVGGLPVSLQGPRRARQLGIGMVYQDFMLIDRLSALENLILNCGDTGLGLGRRHVQRKAAEISQRYGFRLPLRRRVGRLSAGQKQQVEILRLLCQDARILILDEPTSYVGPAETEALFETLGALKAQGTCVIFISHKLAEVCRLADRITVMRSGRCAGAIPVAGTTEEALTRMVVGHVPAILREKTEPPRDEAALKVEKIVTRARHTRQKPVSFTIRKGEIFGIAGVAGSGQDELIEAILGVRPPRRGSIRCCNRNVTGRPLRGLRDMVVAYISAEADRYGLVGRMPLWENVLLGRLHDDSLVHRLTIKRRSARMEALRLMRRYEVASRSARIAAADLSGGNRQKFASARELARQSDLIIAEQPARGLDASAVNIVYNELLAQRSRGSAVLLISYDLDEIFALCDRVGVMFDGALVRTADIKEATPAQVGRWMLGSSD